MILFVAACTSNTDKDLDDFDRIRNFSHRSLELSGQVLSDAYFSACHLKPDPSLLDRARWEK